VVKEVYQAYVELGKAKWIAKKNPMPHCGGRKICALSMSQFSLTSSSNFALCLNVMLLAFHIRLLKVYTLFGNAKEFFMFNTLLSTKNATK
jgi:hypothetical protein